jgi:hypothetical protein
MASDRKAGHGAFGGTHHVVRGGRLAGVRGPETSYPGVGSPGYHGGFIDLGPLGMTAACGSHAQRSGYCGPSYGAPIDAWSY